MKRIKTLFKILGALLAIHNSQRYADGTPGEWLQRLTSDLRFLSPSADEGQEQALVE